MKAEHRKELQTNTLADHLGRLLQNLRAKRLPGSLTIWVFIVLALALVVGWRIYSKLSFERHSEEWLKLDQASTLDDLKRLAEQNAGSVPTRIVRFQLARVQLRQGMEYFCSASRHEDAVKDLESAGKLYAELAEESKDNPILAQEAMLGVAKARESLGDLSGAREWYQKLAEKYPDSVNGKQAAERLKKLDEDGQQMEAFYKKLDSLVSPSDKSDGK
jgi:tetratricopeptide (TPR) repeat protein